MLNYSKINDVSCFLCAINQIEMQVFNPTQKYEKKITLTENNS